MQITRKKIGIALFLLLPITAQAGYIGLTGGIAPPASTVRIRLDKLPHELNYIVYCSSVSSDGESEQMYSSIKLSSHDKSITFKINGESTVNGEGTIASTMTNNITASPVKNAKYIDVINLDKKDTVRINGCFAAD